MFSILFVILLLNNTQRLQKLIYLHLPTDCFMKISLQFTTDLNSVKS